MHLDQALQEAEKAGATHVYRVSRGAVNRGIRTEFDAEERAADDWFVVGDSVPEPEPEGEFTLTIKLGNDTVQTVSDIAEILERVTATLYGRANREEFPDGFALIRDTNGNTVGRWGVRGNFFHA